MNGKTTKMLALVAVIGLCAVALIGAAYAAFTGGTAKTYNEGNAANAEFITITPGGEAGHEWDAISSASIAFSTYTYNDSGTKKAFYIDADPTIEGETVDTVAYDLYQLGTKNFTFKNDTALTITALDVSVKQSAIVGNADFVYVLAIGGVFHVLDNEAPVAELEYEVTGLNIAAGSSSTVAATIYLGCNTNVYLPNEDGDGYRMGKAITFAAYDALDDEVPAQAAEKAKYSDLDEAIYSALEPADFTGLSLAFIFADATS